MKDPGRLLVGVESIEEVSEKLSSLKSGVEGLGWERYLLCQSITWFHQLALRLIPRNPEMSTELSGKGFDVVWSISIISLDWELDKLSGVAGLDKGLEGLGRGLAGLDKGFGLAGLEKGLRDLWGEEWEPYVLVDAVVLNQPGVEALNGSSARGVGLDELECSIGGKGLIVSVESVLSIIEEPEVKSLSGGIGNPILWERKEVEGDVSWI